MNTEINYLMSGGNKRIALFLGAGASVPYDKPTTSEIKSKLSGKFYSHNIPLNTPESILGSFLKNPLFNDIEDVLQSIKEWDALESSYAQKYLRGNGIDLLIRSSAHETHMQIDQFLQHVRRARRTLEDEIFNSYSWNDKFDGDVEKIIGAIFTFVTLEAKDVHVFTTNYDRAVETFCINKSNYFRCIDGFYPSPEKGNYLWGKGDYSYKSNVEGDHKINVYLYKLHGSLDWKLHKKLGIVRTGEEGRSNDPNFLQSMVIFPTVSPKEDAQQEPFATVLKKYNDFMKEANACIAIGCSFRDGNINEVFKNFVEAGRHLVVISPTAKNDITANLLKSEIKDRHRIYLVEKRLRVDTLNEIMPELRLREFP